MKTIIMTIVFTALFATSCSAKTTKEESVSETRNVENKVKIIHLTKAEFLKKVANYETNPTEWKYLGDKPALIDFYADWCGPCKVVAPILEELADEYGGEIYIYKIDTEQEQELASVFGIRSIPSLLFIPMTGQPQMVAGAMPKANLKDVIETVLLKNKTVENNL
ncbi:MAG TPA: thioredoxin [Dysgonomonas sp.]|uniref:thioredoxin n=1 Tax=unclassified Dysgonomonas TaxID=2630389 RepID=UPI0025C237BC|nr:MULTISPECIES: thioredoxin [unclassified Dysgonomonas]HML65119.1 thioredoxin [Dysgonomonas sp.]